MDTQTLLTIYKNVITRDKRIRVTNNNLQWNLHISKVEEKDKGYYMCQINTEPMVSQLGYLDVMDQHPQKSEGSGSPVVKASDHGKHVMSLSPAPLKTRRVRERCTLNVESSNVLPLVGGVPAQMLSSSLDYGSKLRGPPPKPSCS
ncbi:ig domain-containing protein [Trichonephila clavipes]|nr:ig domain-containing protein [Trichonephila clavipes]